jgi:hypothetical protein
VHTVCSRKTGLNLGGKDTIKQLQQLEKKEESEVDDITDEEEVIENQVDSQVVETDE